MQNYRTEYKDYKDHAAIMVSTDRQMFKDGSAVRARMAQYSKLYKELHIVIFSKKNIAAFNISDNCWVYSTNSIFRWNYVKDGIKVGKKIVKKIDKSIPLLVAPQDPFETGLVGKCLANLRENSELMIQIHTDMFSPYFTKGDFLNKIRVLISNFTLPYAQTIRVVSRKIADSLVEKGFDAEKIIVKPIPVDVEYLKNSSPGFSLKEKYPHFQKIVLMVCRLEKEKNIAGALRAFAIASRKIQGMGMVIVGSGRELPKLIKLVRELNIETSVAFEGWQGDLVSYYKGADLLLVTSWYEGYGMVFVEAQAAGLKIVSTDVGIAKEVGAEIVDWDDKKIADKIVQILK